MNRSRVIVAPVAGADASNAELLARAHAMGYRRFAVPPRLVARVPSDAEAVELSEHELRLPSDSPHRAVPIHSAATAGDLERILHDAAADDGPVAVRWTRDRVIPLENALATVARRRAVWVFAQSPPEVSAALGALERGADAVVVPVTTPADLARIEGFLAGSDAAPGPLVEVTIGRVEPVGLGDRVLVDTTSLLERDEGLLVGSAAAFQFLVASEAEGSAHTRPRPFRVNAGAPHLYTPLGNGETRYLSELAPGDALPIVRRDGSARPVRVGRLKIERRPLVMIEADVDGRARTVFLQEAETVRLLSREGARPVTDLGAGTIVLGVRMVEARHVGIPVDERIEER